MFKWWFNKRVAIKVGLSKEKVIQRLKQLSQPDSGFFNQSNYETGKIFLGDVESDKFQLRRKVKLRNILNPIVNGTIMEEGNFTTISVKLKPNKAGLCYFFLFLIAVLFPLAKNFRFIGLVSISWFIPFLVPLLFYLILIIVFNKECKINEELLKHVLKQQI
jgi:hypothetical protein